MPGAREAHGIDPLPLDEESVLQVLRLPVLHRDPFDRMLVCQAIVHGLAIVTPIRSCPSILRECFGDEDDDGRRSAVGGRR